MSIILEMNVRNGREVIRKLRSLPESMRNEVYAELNAVRDDLVNYIQNDLLSGQVLQIRTGALRNSINGQVKVNIVNVKLDVTSDGSVPYAAILETGGQTGPHEIVATRASVLRFIGRSGDVVFRKRVMHPGSRFQEYAYMQRGLLDKRDEITDRVQGAIKRGIDKGMGT